MCLGSCFPTACPEIPRASQNLTKLALRHADAKKRSPKSVFSQFLKFLEDFSKVLKSLEKFWKVLKSLEKSWRILKFAFLKFLEDFSNCYFQFFWNSFKNFKLACFQDGQRFSSNPALSHVTAAVNFWCAHCLGAPFWHSLGEASGRPRHPPSPCTPCASTQHHYLLLRIHQKRQRRGDTTAMREPPTSRHLASCDCMAVLVFIGLVPFFSFLGWS